jgi:branched-chain amino acid transport system substrate-binding protein
VQTFIVATDPNSLNRLSHSCAAQGYHPRYETATLAVSDVEQGNPDLIGLTAPLSTFPWMNAAIPASADYQQAVAAYAPGLTLSPTTSEVWTAGALAQRAAAGLGPTPTPAGFLNGLWSLKDDTLGGLAPPLSFIRGQPAPAASCSFVVRMDASQHWSDPIGTSLEC